MQASTWARVKELLPLALAHATGHRRQVVCALAGDDPRVQAELQSLLAVHEEGPHTLASVQTSFVQAAVQHALDPSWVGRRLGPWRVEALLARGGMGEVYRARRDDGQFDSRVALKCMRGAFDAPTLRPRFENERRILSSLDHPNLARIIDGGISEEGLPYFVMEYVDGEPLDAYCRRLDLPLPQRLALFMTLCRVVHHVHQKGVVHRDLKFSNILVTRDSVLKLVDFGIAKRLQVEGAEQATQTATALRPLTLAYASPEQVAGRWTTPASDIYSLGVVLYQLIAGTGPYRHVDPNNGYALAAAICEQDAAPPSRVATGLAHRYRRRIRGDLDAVVLMALRKEPAHRYASARDLAEDLSRHLQRRPVQARCGAWSYRAGRFVLRHRAVVGAVMIANLALVGGVALASYQAWQAHQQRERAERHFAGVRKLAHVFIFDIHDAIQNLAGSTTARKMVVDNALVYLQGLSAEANSDAALRLEVAAGYRKVGDILGRPNTANLGDSRGAMASYARAKALLAALATDPKERAADIRRARQELMMVYMREGQILGGLGQAKEGLASVHAGSAIAADLAAADPANRENQLQLVDMYRVQSEIELASGELAAYTRTSDAAIRLLEAAVARAPDDREVVARLSALYNTRGTYFLWRDASDEGGGRLSCSTARLWPCFNGCIRCIRMMSGWRATWPSGNRTSATHCSASATPIKPPRNFIPRSTWFQDRLQKIPATCRSDPPSSSPMSI